MDRAAFETRLREQGYDDVANRELAANFANEPHAHDFDAQLLILDGEITIAKDGAADVLRQGDTCEVPAGTVHRECAGPEGVRYIAARRRAAASG
ncbi:MAG: cupin domain-containing protein [Alphaproteobacteria bacterium]|nr:cupin domain-containing protein [Alphaproteobacteria bacterium]